MLVYMLNKYLHYKFGIVLNYRWIELSVNIINSKLIPR